MKFHLLRPRVCLGLLLWLISSGLVLGQYNIQGLSARELGNDCYLITDDINWQKGTMWYQQAISLRNSFSLEFSMNFGNKDLQGADGMVFALQTRDNTSAGQTGQGIGFGGFSPALGIEFDTYQNTDENDPTYDHIAVLRDGIVNHQSSANLAGPVRALGGQDNIEDGAEHLVRIRWLAPQKILEVYFDCERRINASIDIAAIFGNQDEVFWGFTGATGGVHNRQTVCIKSDIFWQDALQVCRGEELQLMARNAPDGVYRWSPASALAGAANVRNPTVRPDRDQLFVVEYRDFCNQTVRDSVLVTLDPSPRLPDTYEPPTSKYCPRDGPVKLVAKALGDGLTYRWPHSGEEQATVSVEQAGTFEVVVTGSSGCQLTESMKVVDACPLSLWIPDAFSPNADGQNDQLRVFTSAAAELRFRVYDRWGAVVFFSDAGKAAWDGRFQGVLCPPGAYTWRAEYRPADLPDSPLSTKRGVVWLVH